MANRPVRHRDIEPTHPGAILREDMLPALDRPKKEIAELLGVSRQTLHKILTEQSPITPEMALRIGKLCGNGPGIWLRLQQAYDIWHAERELGAELEAIPTLHAA